VQRVGLLLIYLVGTQPGNAEQPRKRGTKGGRIEFGRRILVCHVQEADPSIVFKIEFIALVVHLTQYPLGLDFW
jgi:hypothetical protein